MKETVFEKSMALNPGPIRVTDRIHNLSRFENSSSRKEMTKIY